MRLVFSFITKEAYLALADEEMTIKNKINIELKINFIKRIE